MHIHKFERFWIYSSYVLIAFFIVSVVYGFVGLDLKVMGDYKSVDPQNLGDTEFAKTGVQKAPKDDLAEYEVHILTLQFAFAPGTAQPIEVPAQTPITFYITSPDVIHGFEVVGTNLNAMAIPGQVSKFTTVFPEAKSYGLLCNEYCGPGHHLMEGQIKVVPKSQYLKDHSE